MKPRARINWLVLFAIWTGIGLVLLAQTLATVARRGDTPEAVWEYYSTATYLQMTRAWLWCLFTPVVFELRRRIPSRGWRLPLGVVLHVAFAAAIIVWILQVRFWSWGFIQGMPLTNLISFDEIIWGINPRVLIDVLIYVGLLGAGSLLDLQAEKQEALDRAQELRLKLTEQVLQQEQLRSELVQAEMKALKQQLHPHFLFNALNAVSGLVRRGENARAVEALARVSSLLRALIGSTGRAEVTLEEELSYCRTYLDIEKMRFDERLNFEFDVEPVALVAEVPTLLLQPMVENAIKHGIAGRRTPGEVRIRAQVAGERLLLEIANDPAEHAQGAPPPRPPADNHGLGLATTRARLERSYGQAFRLDFHLGTPRGTVVAIEVPFRPAESAVPVRV